MKTQAWGWLAAAVLAAGLNSSYHEGGMQWAHEIADGVEHNTGAVLALATGRADEFLAEARMLNVTRAVEADTDNQPSRCPFSMAATRVQKSFELQPEFDGFQALSDREQARLARLEANRARIEAQIQSRLARIEASRNKFVFASPEFAGNNFTFDNDSLTPVVVRVPRIRCPRVRVVAPRVPRVRVRVPKMEVPAPVVEVDNSEQGPI